MNKIIPLFVFLVFGCQPSFINSENFFDKSFTIGAMDSVTIGEPIIQWEYGVLGNYSVLTNIVAIDSLSSISGNYKKYRYNKDSTYQIRKKLQSTKKRLVYVGEKDGIIRMKYQVFFFEPNSNAMIIKEPYCYDLEYNLNSQNTLFFQKIRLAIHSANQNRIVFTVIEVPQHLEEQE